MARANVQGIGKAVRERVVELPVPQKVAVGRVDSNERMEREINKKSPVVLGQREFHPKLGNEEFLLVIEYDSAQVA